MGNPTAPLDLTLNDLEGAKSTSLGQGYSDFEVLFRKYVISFGLQCFMLFTNVLCFCLKVEQFLFWNKL